MRVALISDVHANLAALEAVLRAAEQEAADEIWFLGDAVGYGARPDECCLLLSSVTTEALAGNHDLGVLRQIPLEDFQSRLLPTFAWTLEQLSDDAHSWLASLAPYGRPEGQSEIGLYHGSPRDPVWEYVLTVPLLKQIWAAIPDRLVFVGHSHLPFAYPDALVDGRIRDVSQEGKWVELGKERWIINPGSVGQPRDGDWRASFLLLDLDAQRFQLRRVEYEVERTVAEILAAPLPKSFAYRLQEGH